MGKPRTNVTAEADRAFHLATPAGSPAIAAVAPGVAPPPVGGVSWTGDLITCLLSAWLVVGVFVDGWAHNTRSQLETFFTPWHALFYSGFAAVTAWMGRLLLPGVRSGLGLRRSAPPGYGWAAIGIGIFLLSGVGDLTWHQLFGIEQDVAALLSPTHLGLACGAILMVTAPWRSARADPGLAQPHATLKRLLPAVLSATLVGCGVAFILQEWHPVKDNMLSAALHRDLVLRYGRRFHDVSTLQMRAGVASFILASIFLFGPLLLLSVTWVLPRGSALIALLSQCLLMQALTGFADPGLVILGVLGAVAVEGLVQLLRPGPANRGRLRLFFLLAPPLFWGVFVTGIVLADHHLGWRAEVWGGSLVWSGLVMAGLAVLATLAPGGSASGPVTSQASENAAHLGGPAVGESDYRFRNSQPARR